MQTLLLVDDEPNIVEGLASQFEQRYGDGVIVLKSCSGRHALSVLQNNRVDVVLSDIRMPDLDGLELIEETERLWPRTHFVLLSGFEDFDYIHRASKSTIYRGYLLKSEGDEVVMEKVDKELRLCAEELREETQQGLQRAFLQRAALESALGRGFLARLSEPDGVFFFGVGHCTARVHGAGKSPAHDAMDGMQSMQLISGVLAAQAPGISFEALLPEEGTLVWLLQEKAPTARPGTEKYIHALFEAIQQQMSDVYDCAVGLIVGSVGRFDAIVEQYGRLNNIWAMVARDTGRLIIVDESDYSEALLSRGDRCCRNSSSFPPSSTDWARICVWARQSPSRRCSMSILEWSQMERRCCIVNGCNPNDFSRCSHFCSRSCGRTS
ncbi:MAG: response regulator [Ruthenibacterium lactatiformans]